MDAVKEIAKPARFERALLDAAQCVNLKPKWAKGYYRLGCALEAAKAYKECASVFAKVVELEPDNAEASGRLLKALHRSARFR